jgi:hypothetical protein
MAGSIGDLPDAYLNRYSFEGLDVPGDIKRWAQLAGSKYADLRGRVLSAPNQKDGSIEVLMRIDTQLVKSAELDKKTKNLLERIVRMIDTGQQLTCSMGANVAYSVCSTCGNEARFANEYCEHLKPMRKGSLTIVPANQIRDLLSKDLLRPEWLTHTIASKHDIHEVLAGMSNKGVAVRNIELNHKVSFFELSVVATPAYPDAIALEKFARKQDESHPNYIKRLAREFSNEDVLMLYTELQDRGLIATACTVA